MPISSAENQSSAQTVAIVLVVVLTIALIFVIYNSSTRDAAAGTTAGTTAGGTSAFSASPFMKYIERVRTFYGGANKPERMLPLPPTGETQQPKVKRSSFRPLKKTSDDHLNSLALEGMSGRPSASSFTVTDADVDLSPFNDTVDRNEVLANIALTNEQRKDHRNYVKKRMVYARTANTPHQSLEFIDSNWRGLRMPRYVNPNRTNPSSTIEIANVDIMKDLGRTNRRI